MAVVTAITIYRYLARDNTDYERSDFLEMWYSMHTDERLSWMENFKEMTE